MYQSFLPFFFSDETPVESAAPSRGVDERQTRAIDKATESEDLGFSVQIKRSPRRRSMEIVVRGGAVNLMLPQFVSNVEGLAFVQLKREWILKTLAKQAQHQSEIVQREYKEGALFSYLGRDYPLRIYFGAKAEVELINNQLNVQIPKRHLKSSAEQKATAVQKALWGWYQGEALRILTHKVDLLSQKIKRPYAAVQLRRTKNKWGHCTRDGVLQFNWQIICAPEPVVDYLVAHEVSHLVHHNHGQRFWRHVERIYPDYKVHQQWLRRNEHRLTV